MNRLCSRLGIELPLVQAPTGSVAGPELAAAVSAAGGLGGLGLTWTSSEDAAARIRDVRGRTDRPFLVNFVLSFEPRGLSSVLEAGAPVVTFSWGQPDRYVEQCRQAGAMVGVQVANADGARRASDLGADFLVCQGLEAGGHVQATLPLRLALEQVLAAAPSTPVVAAGGIADAADIARVMLWGADAAMLGTRFVATVESRAHAAYKERLIAAASTETALTVCFDGGWPHAPHRVLRNATLEAWEAAGCPPPGARPGEGEAVAYSTTGEPIPRYEDAAPRQGMTGAVEEMALYAGMGVEGVTDLPPAGELVRRLWAETDALLNP